MNEKANEYAKEAKKVLISILGELHPNVRSKVVDAVVDNIILASTTQAV